MLWATLSPMPPYRRNTLIRLKHALSFRGKTSLEHGITIEEKYVRSAGSLPAGVACARRSVSAPLEDDNLRA
jgi:hypothetical protein